MSKKENQNVNITLNTKEKEDSEIVVSIFTLIRKLKKYLLIWIIAAVLCIGIAVAYSMITTHVQKPTLTALIGFSYDGIEKGLDPNGRDFKVETIKNPNVIESALTDLNLEIEQLEYVRQGITITGITPKDTVARLTQYSNVINKNGNIAAAEKILETTYFPTQYTVAFDYSATDFTDEEAVQLFNRILENYKVFFYQEYGYNESLGSALSVISYEDYDYTEAIDVFSNSVDTLKKYVKELADDDDTRFRSSVTGYTFDDLYEAISTVEKIDLDKISSYIVVNNLTKNKEDALAYCEYRIKTLTRQRLQYEEELEAYENSIKNYEKDQMIVFGTAGEETSTQTSIASEQYDEMFKQKNIIASNLAQTKQQISYYKERQETLKSKSTGSSEKTEKIETDLKNLSDKINNLINAVSDTSEDYYVNVTFKNAYNVLVPAADVSTNRFDRIKQNVKFPLLVLEAIAFIVYFAIAFIEALTSDSRNRKLALAAAGVDVDKKDEEDAEKESDEKDTKDDKKKKNKDNKENE